MRMKVGGRDHMRLKSVDCLLVLLRNLGIDDSKMPFSAMYLMRMIQKGL